MFLFNDCMNWIRKGKTFRCAHEKKKCFHERCKTYTPVIECTVCMGEGE